MASKPILPFDVWPPGSTQPSIPVNDNALRSEILCGMVLSKTTTAQPASPAPGAIYILPDGHTGAQWALFAVGDLVIHYGGTWYAFGPVEGVVVHLPSGLQQYVGGDWVAGYAGEPIITPGTTAQYWRGDKTWQDLQSAVRTTVLTGLSTATSAAILATDTLLAALGKAQAQITTLDGAVVKTTGAQTVAGAKTFSSPVLLPDGTAANPAIAFSSNTNKGLYHVSNNIVGISAGGSGRIAFSPSGVVVGNPATASHAVIQGGITPTFQIAGGSSNAASVAVIANSNDATVPRFFIGKNRGGGAVAVGDLLGASYYVGHDGTDNILAAYESAVVISTPTTGNVPIRVTRVIGSATIEEATSTQKSFAVPVRLPQYTLTTLPSAAAFSGHTIDVTNATGGPKQCRSNGTAWHITNTTTVVS